MHYSLENNLSASPKNSNPPPPIKNNDQSLMEVTSKNFIGVSLFPCVFS